MFLKADTFKLITVKITFAVDCAAHKINSHHSKDQVIMPEEPFVK